MIALKTDSVNGRIYITIRQYQIMFRYFHLKFPDPAVRDYFESIKTAPFRLTSQGITEQIQGVYLLKRLA